jgi:hypothetical protein
MGLRTTGFGSVSYKNNHIDVFCLMCCLLYGSLEKTGNKGIWEMVYSSISMLSNLSSAGGFKNCARILFVSEVVQQAL